MWTEDSTERYYANMEHARSFHEDEYFKTRPQLLRTHVDQVLFRAAFERAFKFMWERFVNAEADMLRLHRELMALKYLDSPETVLGSNNNDSHTTANKP
jgi:hypothetical protein